MQQFALCHSQVQACLACLAVSQSNSSSLSCSGTSLMAFLQSSAEDSEAAHMLCLMDR